MKSPTLNRVHNTVKTHKQNKIFNSIAHIINRVPHTPLTKPKGHTC